MAEERDLIIRSSVRVNTRNRKLKAKRKRPVYLDSAEQIVAMTPALRDELTSHRQPHAGAAPTELVFPTSTGSRRDKDNARERVIRPVVAHANELLARRRHTRQAQSGPIRPRLVPRLAPPVESASCTRRVVCSVNAHAQRSARCR